MTAIAGEQRVVVACSALRRAYRDPLREARSDLVFVRLDAERSVLASRIASREDRFMPAALLDSPLSALERLEPDERGVVFDGGRPVAEVVDQATEWISLNV